MPENIGYSGKLHLPYFVQIVILFFPNITSSFNFFSGGGEELPPSPLSRIGIIGTYKTEKLRNNSRDVEYKRSIVQPCGIKESMCMTSSAYANSANYQINLVCKLWK